MIDDYPERGVKLLNQPGTHETWCCTKRNIPSYPCDCAAGGADARVRDALATRLREFNVTMVSNYAADAWKLMMEAAAALSQLPAVPQGRVIPHGLIAALAAWNDACPGSVIQDGIAGQANLVHFNGEDVVGVCRVGNPLAHRVIVEALKYAYAAPVVDPPLPGLSVDHLPTGDPHPCDERRDSPDPTDGAANSNDAVATRRNER